MTSGAPCVDCGAFPAPRSVAGEAVSECTSCGTLRASRSAVKRLRDTSPAAHPLLAPPPVGPAAAVAPAPLSRIRRCPACQTTLLAHTFGGGKVRVESCETCELVYLPRGRLAAIVKEACDGIELSDEARAVLHHERMLTAGNRFITADFGLGTAGAVALLLFLRIVARTGFSTTAAAGGSVIALGFLLYLRRKWGKQRTEEASRMERLAAAELFRLEQAEREKAQREPLGAGPEPGSDRAAGKGPLGDGTPLKRNDRRAPSSGTRPRPCPVCRAKLPEGTTHCTACDSDFG